MRIFRIMKSRFSSGNTSFSETAPDRKQNRRRKKDQRKSGKKSRNLKFFSVLILLITIAAGAATEVFLWRRFHDPVACGAVGLFVLLVFLLVLCAGRMNRRYCDDLLEDLTLLIEEIIDAEFTCIFPENEDSLTSRLQNQIRKLAHLLKLQNDRLAEEKDSIQSLISDISHQIRTPVSAVRMFGELLQTQEDVTEEERKEYCENLQKSLDKLTFLTDSLIRMSRLESGIVRFRPRRQPVSDLILEAVHQIQHAAKSRETDIVIGNIVSADLTYDLKWTTEALVNILDNAVKYTPEKGRVEISVSEYPSYLCISVSDNGAGIPEEEQALIFQRFYRGSASPGRDGIGIGLYLARRIIVEQNGYIRVSSAGRQAGSCFSVFLKKTQEGDLCAS